MSAITALDNAKPFERISYAERRREAGTSAVTTALDLAKTAPEAPRVINLILPMPPSANRYWRTACIYSRKLGKWIAVTYVSEEAKAYKETVADIAGLATPIYGDIAITVKVFRERRAGDYHNRTKVLFDALQGVVYENDSQIAEDHGYKFDDPKHPRVEVEIRLLGLC